MNWYGSYSNWILSAELYRSGMHVQLPLVTYSPAQHPLMCFNEIAS